ncbi:MULTISPECIES: DUF4062 domain-containing protein [Acinetobacter calcoaceticus/baumannii complex]|uniref:DUF4062 domain-containing protein n=1 Tax=Acinetobacter calcoaceticus/baumannii complex TaxID=909768 RepID=UPI00148DAD36|nr:MULTISPECIES: DUF4062 domain-containing protein [Acinetobacter calcoaceticus/baumannii complex]MDC5111722.1 DUF4062 domain-containing protein [Acinetobacter baumannii]MDH2485983.1 DUF4062 domain-containing protein [Acinetobacter baumannii]MDH2516610.1 DUF4062 domain-containing protein [Acinetobacter baumannii]MDK2103999.1 DUF4062 domain-containing protein [Acinetobacter baumannii]MDK2149716.1 DUF4062 domain-containing protein [Acinetobacter baumannii]
MSGLKIFISSTCYDLFEERAQVRNLLLNLGHDPILSDHNDVHYDHHEHTHVSCIRQISNADMVILLVGSRYGGVAIDDALKEINLDIIQDRLNSKIKLKDLIEEMQERTQKSAKASEADSTIKKIRYGFSITHFEILRAIQEDIPIYAFVKDKVWNFNELYTFNKDKIEDLTIPSIEKNHSKYLFEFIEILKNRKYGNSIQSYSNYLDIEQALKKQLAEKLKTLMDERKNLRKESAAQQDYINKLTDRFDDLKEAILSVLPKGNERVVAKGVIKFRKLISSLSYMISKVETDIANINEVIITSNFSLEEIITTNLNISKIISTDINDNFKDLFNIIFRSRHPLHRNAIKNILISENYFFIIENSRIYEDLKDDWNDFIKIDEPTRRTIVEALNENNIPEIISYIRYIKQDMYSYAEERIKEAINSQEISESTIELINSILLNIRKDSDDDTLNIFRKSS